MNRSQLLNPKIIAWYLLILIPALVIQLTIAQNDISIYVNNNWNAWLDQFFKYYTHVGDGWTAITIGLLVAYKNKKLGITILVVYASSSLFTQFLKHWVFDEMDRPTWVMREQVFHLVDGVEVFAYNSFPSGHTTTAFALATTLAWYANRYLISGLLFIAAVLIAYSRIYLMQHYFQDTLAASFIGFGFATLVYFILNRKDSSIE